MIPVTQFILGNSDPLLYPSEKMTNSIDEQIAFLHYAKLFEEWFGGNIDNKVFESAITFWFKDVDFDGDKVWEYFHMNN
nr:MAG: hypothetical protein [Bacteriophage sp.]